MTDSTPNTENDTMNAPLTTADLESVTARAAVRHAAKGTASLGQIVVLTFQGLEIAVGDAVSMVTGADLDADDLPELRDRGAVRKALQSLGIYPSAHHNSKGESEAAKATADGSCLRYSSVRGEDGDSVYYVYEERRENDASGNPVVVQAGERQRLVYRSKGKDLQIVQDLLRPEIVTAFAYYRGAFKSESIRTFATRTLAKTKAVKFAGSTWFVPVGGEEIVAKLRSFCRLLPAGTVSFTAVSIVDEPVNREDVGFNASAAVLREVEDLAKSLALHTGNRDGGTRVKPRTVDNLLDKGRDLREKLRTLKTLLGLEVSEVEGQLGELDTNVRKFLDEVSEAEAAHARAAAAKAARAR